MRLALTLLALALPFAGRAATPVLVSERQVIALEFSQPIQRLAVSDPEPLGLKAAGATVKVTGRRAGKAQLDVVFTDGATASFDVTVAPLRGSAARPAAPDEIELEVGEERRIPSPAGSQVLLEDNGVARAEQEPGGVVVRGLMPGRSSLVVVDPSGNRTTWKLRVR